MVRQTMVTSSSFLKRADLNGTVLFHIVRTLIYDNNDFFIKSICRKERR